MTLFRCWALVLFLVLITGGSAFTEQPTPVKVRVVVFPFEINAGKDLQYLRDSLPRLLNERLTGMGFEVQDMDRTEKLLHDEKVSILDLQTAKDMALLSKAQYAVYGSFSQVGETISLDARLVEAFGLKDPAPMYVVKSGLIELLPAIDELAGSIKSEMQREDRIAEIVVEGLRTLEKDVVLMRLKVQVGDTFDRKKLSEEIRRLFELGYFDDVQVSVEDGPGGKKIIFLVAEKPLIKAMSVIGSDAIDEDDILKAMSSKVGAVLNPRTIVEDLDKIRELYRKKGYYTAKITHDLEQADPREARLIIRITEGNKLFIQEIHIEGAKQLDEDDMKKELALSERGLFSWITGTGVLKEEMLDRDAAALEAYYGNRGFADVKVGQPSVVFKDDGIIITFKVSEGVRYKVGTVSFRGDFKESPEELNKHIKLDDLAQKNDYFDRSVLRQDAQRLSDYYTNFGYAYAETDIALDKKVEEKIINVTFSLRKDQKVSIRRLLIEGNDKTRNNVILREMRLTDGDIFSGTKLGRSNARLRRLEFFETVDIENVPTANRSEMDLKIKVKEKPTGMFTAGVGYSTVENFFVTGRVAENNLFGKGYNLAFSGTFGGKTTAYDLRFMNPHVYDTQLGAGLDVYHKNEKFSYYDKESAGGRAKMSYPIGEYTRVGFNYRLEQYTISNVDEDASDSIKDFEGQNWASAIFGSISRDSTDRILNPTKGSTNTLSVEFAGGPIGGDDNFVKVIYDSSFYYPLLWDFIFHWHGQIGYVAKNSDEKIPPFERFFLGGINNVRGYEGRKISPVDEGGEEYGGNKELFTNFEILYPLSQDIGLVGVLFFDAGDTWAEDENMSLDLYKSVGVGLRWYSPMGPLRFEYGYPLDELDGKKNGKFEFTIGQFF